MYAVSIEGRPLTFTVSGLLWNRSLVMQDLQTGTLWSHILGRAMQGELKDRELENIPSVLTTWGAWRANHPQTTVLAMSRTAKEFTLEFQQRPDIFVLGLVWRGQAKAYPFDVLKQEKLVHDVVQDTPLLILFDPESTAGRVFGRRVNQKIYSFRAHQEPGRIRDDQTGSVWDATQGVCLEGDLAGTKLEPVAGIVSFRRIWKRFHPESQWYSGR